MNKMQTLSKNQQIIFDLIHKSPEPMKAYAILFNVQKKVLKLHYKFIEHWIS